MANTEKIVVAIDGPAGSGKSTVARKLAKRLGFIHLNSGALFRAIAFLATGKGLSLEDDEAVSNLARSVCFKFDVEPSGQTRLLVNGRDLGEQINARAAGEKASLVAVLPKVRQVLLEVQRNIAQHSSVVVEGRDSTTVVFPDAQFKLYLDASPQVRADRRFSELQAKGGLKESMSREQILDEILKRDQRDMTRECAPHRRADDATLIDTSSLTIDEVLARCLTLIEETTERPK